MKLATDKAHRDYFYKNGNIEFDSIFNPAQVNEMNEAIDTILCKSLATQPKKLSTKDAGQLFREGRDLWRKDESIQKLLLNKRLAEIAVELMEVRSLRMGYDQLLLTESKSVMSDPKDPYHQFLLQTGTLQERSCLTPVICGLMICLKPALAGEPNPLFSNTAGNVVFFKGDLPLDLSFLTYAEEGRYLLLSLVDPRTVYILNEKDPQTHALKRLGLVFGDRLTDKLNPLYK